MHLKADKRAASSLTGVALTDLRPLLIFASFAALCCISVRHFHKWIFRTLFSESLFAKMLDKKKCAKYVQTITPIHSM